MGQITLRITGMTCGHCVTAVTRALKAVPGVKSADVDLERNEGVVIGHVKADMLIKAIAEEGYGAEVIA
ncbi:MAG: CopZ family metallochaperone [Acidiferrobacter sp.]